MKYVNQGKEKMETYLDDEDNATILGSEARDVFPRWPSMGKRSLVRGTVQGLPVAGDVMPQCTLVKAHLP